MKHHEWRSEAETLVELADAIERSHTSTMNIHKDLIADLKKRIPETKDEKLRRKMEKELAIFERNLNEQIARTADIRMMAIRLRQKVEAMK